MSQEYTYQTVKVTLYLTETQENLFNRLFGCCRVVYNKLLDMKEEAYKKDKTILSQQDLQKAFHAELNKDPNLAFLNEFNSNILKYEIINLCDAYKNTFKYKYGFPKHKSRRDDNSATFSKGTAISKSNLEDGKINLTKNIKNLKFRTSKKYTEYLYQNRESIQKITISKDKCGKYHAAILFRTVNLLLNKNMTTTPINEVVGLDMGVKHAVVTSKGKYYENLKLTRQNEKVIAKLSRNVSRKKKGSKNREKARLKLAKKHNHIANQRKYHINNITTDIVNENQVIIVEDLNIKGMMKNRKMSKSIQDVSWGEIVWQLIYKAKKYGRVVYYCDRYFPSSKKCSRCGNVKESLSLNERIYTCNNCGLEIDRDLNPGINLELIYLGVWRSELRLAV